VISMRSLFVFTTALLPTAAAILIGTVAVRGLAGAARRLLARPSPARIHRPPPSRRA
jgi:hypothetical protein